MWMTITMTRTITRILICQIKKDNQNNDDNLLYTDEQPLHPRDQVRCWTKKTMTTATHYMLKNTTSLQQIKTKTKKVHFDTETLTEVDS